MAADSLERLRTALDRLKTLAGRRSPAAALPVKASPRALPAEAKPTDVEIIPPKITAAQVAKAVLDIRNSLELQESEGDINTWNLNITPSRQEKEFRHPVTRELQPLIVMSLFNDGPSNAYFRVNYPSSATITLENGESVNVDFTKSRRKIRSVFYHTDPGGSASARIVGKF